MKSVPGFESAASGFNETLKLLAASHDRIAAQLPALEPLVAHVAVRGSVAAARDAALAVTRRFDIAGERRHEDEDQGEGLFPLLRAHAAKRSARS